MLNIASYARRGPAGAPLTAAEIGHISRTVRRVPEVMVKVLGHGGKDLGAVLRHFDYLSRKGELALETDDDQVLRGRGTEKTLLSEWDLEIESARPTAQLQSRSRPPPRLVHKLMFSMPAGSPPEAVLSAVKAFCREEFALKHRYALVLHTDEPHPHVHVVVKAMSEQGQRLNIRKATLRLWRSEFARQLRAQGVDANATERAVRGANGPRKRDPIYRASLRNASTHLHEVLRQANVTGGDGLDDRRHGAVQLAKTRRSVIAGWHALANGLMASGDDALAREVRDFVQAFRPVRTDGELLVARAAASEARSEEVQERAPLRSTRVMGDAGK